MPYQPNEQMRSAASRALEYRRTLPPSAKFGTAVGIARARDIANNERLSAETILRMYSFLKRHQKNYEMYVGAEKKGKGYWSYLLWGGPSALPWAEDKLEKMRKAGEI